MKPDHQMRCKVYRYGIYINKNHMPGPGATRKIFRYSVRLGLKASCDKNGALGVGDTP